MKVIDILNKADENTQITIQVKQMGLKFTTQHYVDYFFRLDDNTVCGMEVNRMFVQDSVMFLEVN